MGNGAAELIKSLMEQITGTVGFIRPTFEEYWNRHSRGNDSAVVFMPDNADYAYGADDIIRFFGARRMDALILINPDNPSGNYLPKRDLLRLIAWAADREIRLIVDESFVDFADELDSTLIDQRILRENPHLYVVKSISKSYGVPGLRLGVLASGDESAIANIKQDVAIWNINSFAEFYLQIAEKYQKDYLLALEKLRQERRRFEAELSRIRMLRVVPSQANFVMVEILDGVSPRELLKRLLIHYNLLIKELITKTNGRDYMRLAVRSREDNDILIAALHSELEDRKSVV